MEVLSLRKYLFDKVQYVNELGQDIDFYKKILIAPASLLDKQADYKILKVFSKNYTELKTHCLSKEGNESNTLSYCDALLPAYTDLEKKLDELYAKRQQLDEEYKLISQDIKDFGQTLSGKHNYSLIKDIFEIRKGFYNKKPDNVVGGNIPFIGATDSNNGITSYCDIDTIERTSKTGDSNNAPLSEKIFEANCITVSNNGSIGFAFYQSRKFNI